MTTTTSTPEAERPAGGPKALGRSMTRSCFPGPLAWLAALGVHVGVVYLVAPPF